MAEKRIPTQLILKISGQVLIAYHIGQQVQYCQVSPIVYLLVNLFPQALSHQGAILVDQITGDICTNDYANMFFISPGEVDDGQNRGPAKNSQKSEPVMVKSYSSTLDV